MTIESFVACAVQLTDDVTEVLRAASGGLPDGDPVKPPLDRLVNDLDALLRIIRMPPPPTATK